MDLLYPKDYNRITSRLRNKFSKILSREVVDIESRRPFNFLEGFGGDYQWIFDIRSTDSNFNGLKVENSMYGGIVVLGLDLAHGLDIIFSKCIQPNIGYQQRKILRNCVGMMGQEAIDFYNTNNVILDQISTLDDSKLNKTTKIGLNIYWDLLVESYPWINKSRIDSDYHTVLGSLLLDYGFNNYKLMNDILAFVQNDNRAGLSHYLFRLSLNQNTSLEKRNRRALESGFLLRHILPLSGSVGQGCDNDAKDVFLISEMMDSLGFAETVNSNHANYTYTISERYDGDSNIIGWNVVISNNFNQPAIIQIYDSFNFDEITALNTAKQVMNEMGDTIDGVTYPKSGSLILPNGQNNLGVDFSVISNFKKLVLGSDNCSPEIFPGDATHLWLCSKNAPKIVALSTTYPGVGSCASEQNSMSKTIDWVESIIVKTGRHFSKISQFELNSGVDINPNGLHIFDASVNNLEFKISIPSLLGTTNSVEDIEYNKDTMRLILQSLISQEGVNSKGIYLYDLELAQEGLCTLKPLDENSPHSPKNYVHVRLENKELILTEFVVNKNTNNSPINSPLAGCNVQDRGQNLSELIIDNTGKHLDLNEDILTRFYTKALFDVIPNELSEVSGAVISPVIQEPLQPNVPYFIGIKNWKNHTQISPQKNNYNDTLILMWNDGTKLKIKNYLLRTTPKLSRSYSSMLGDLHVLPGRYKFLLSEKDGEIYFEQSSPIECAMDIDKEGQVSEISPIQIINQGLTIQSGGEKVRVGKEANGSQLIYGGKGANSPISEIRHILLDELQLSIGDEIVYSLIDSETMLDCISLDDIERDVNNPNNLESVQLQYVINGTNVYDISNTNIGVDVLVQNNLNLPNFVLHYPSGTDLQVAISEVSSLVGIGSNSNQEGFEHNGYHYPRNGEMFELEVI